MKAKSGSRMICIRAELMAVEMNNRNTEKLRELAFGKIRLERCAQARWKNKSQKKMPKKNDNTQRFSVAIASHSLHYCVTGVVLKLHLSCVEVVLKGRLAEAKNCNISSFMNGNWRPVVKIRSVCMQ
jgi:hypothetical protein